MSQQPAESDRQERIYSEFKVFELPPWSTALELARELIHPLVLAIYRRGDEKRGEAELPPAGEQGP